VSSQRARGARKRRVVLGQRRLYTLHERTQAPGAATINVMRYTIVDQRGTASFVAPCEALVPLLGACVGGARSLDELLTAAEGLGARLLGPIQSGLAVFDE